MATVMDRLDPSDAEDAEHILAMILSDDVSDSVSIDDGMYSDEYVELRGDLESSEDTTSDDDCCNEVDATDNCFNGKEKMKWHKVENTTHI